MLEEPEAAIKQLSPKTQVLSVTANILNEEDVESLFKKATDAFGTIDVVTHAAGSMFGGPVGDASPELWFKDYEVNVKGTYILVHYYLKTVTSGTFIVLGTIGASFTSSGLSAYSGSKLAMQKLVEYLDAGT